MGHGKFSGEPEAVWLTQEGTPDRRMRILQDFSFTDPASKIWPAPAGSLVDGASIPRALWTVVGSPYTGDYRRASIVHDVACDEAVGNKKKRRAADRMFFHACRAGGCSIWEATVLYLGVRVGAAAGDVPSWHAAMSIQLAGPRTRRTEDELRLEQDFKQITDRVLAQGETDDPDELERRTDAAFEVVLGLKPVRSTNKTRGVA
jgi:uncharacterized protein DUF1353